MATTTYTVFATETGEVIVTKSKKSAAIEAAREARDEQKIAVIVKTQTGHEAFALAAPKKIKMSAPYTRVVPVPEEVVETINGQRVAYKRGRKGAQFALLDAAKGQYTIWDMDRSEAVPVEVSTTREAGRWFADERQAYRAANPVPALEDSNA